jgi:plastocyanin
MTDGACTSFRATRRRVALRTTAGAVMACLAACSGYGAPTSSMMTTPVVPTGPTDVTVVNNAFTPANLSVSAGGTVTWTWNSCFGGDVYGNGQTCVNHDIVFDDGTTSGIMSQGSFQRQFSAAGSYPYHCSIHGAAMSGNIVVQ